MGPAGSSRMLCGWMTTEVGRQPYTVYGLLRTADSVSPIALPGVATSLAVFVVVYFIVFGAGHRGHPAPDAPAAGRGRERTPHRHADPHRRHPSGPAGRGAARHRQATPRRRSDGP